MTVVEKLAITLNAGASWQRWEPHVHAPGTIFNDQFKGDWANYLEALENAEPPIKVIAVTDYYLLDTYQKVCAEKATGRLPQCEMLFPNVELRLDVGTAKAWINIHLLVSPEDDRHVDELARFLSRLSFRAYEDTFICQVQDLVRLGKAAKPEVIADNAALRVGAEHFKVSFEQLRQEYKNSAWAQKNILIAVAGGQGDGSSALQNGADQTLRRELERFAHIIFSSNPNQREFWLGRKTLDADGIRAAYDHLKPCLHGSDAHSVAKTGNPDGNRYTWIKGAPAFDTLRQAVIDPVGRAYIGEEPPPMAAPSETIFSISITGASTWAMTPVVPLNAGLVAIIGARGSGKTALADIIAAGCDGHADHIPEQAFLVRAQEHLTDSSVELHWKTGEVSTRNLDGRNSLASDSYPRARYLSQQFVDNLCSSDGVTDGLLSEVERVIFDAHPISNRDGAIDFSDFREIRSARHRAARVREEQSLAVLSERIGAEIEKHKLLPTLAAQVKEKDDLVKRYTADRLKLVSKGSEERVARLTLLSTAAEKVRNNIRFFKTQEQQLLLMQDEISSFRASGAIEDLRELQHTYPKSGIATDEWDAFIREYKGDVDAVLARLIERSRRDIAAWRGTPADNTGDTKSPLIAEDADLSNQTLSLLEGETSRIEQLISIDKDVAQRFKSLSSKITSETELLKGLNDKLQDSKEAKGRLDALVIERETTYSKVFDAVIAEQTVLRELYAPIREKLESASGTLNRLSFSVDRIANLDRWAAEGEELLDLRKQGPFRGKGALVEAARARLKKQWENGTAEEVVSAMRAFRDEYSAGLLEHAAVSKTDPVEYRAWTKRFAKWLYSTDHIVVRYHVNYDSIDIRKLSPGTRGIVLLLLYLSLDDTDTRPLIIDQPEENLDPKSIYDDLVGLFLTAKTRRQIIMVTHNANLVINTDADQVIIASSGTSSSQSLPEITYTSGGLEEDHIRRAVCDILEGGADAFKDRARRLRVRLNR